MKIEELERLDEGRKLANEIKVGEKFLEVINDTDYEVGHVYLCKDRYDGVDFPFASDEFNRAHRDFLKTWTEGYVKVLKNKFEAL